MTNLLVDDFTGSNGAAWSSSNWTSAAGTTGSSATIQGNRGRLNAGTNTSFSGKKAMRYATGQIADLEWIGQFTFTTTVNGGFEVWGRTDSGAAGGTGYFLRIDGGGTITINKAVSFSYTQLDSHSFTVSQNTDYKFRFYVVGTSIKAKIWLASNSEPASYDMEATDSAVTGSNFTYVAAIGGSASGMIVDLDNVTLTNGQSNQFTYTGSVSSSGVLAKSTLKAFVGAITPAGLLSHMKVVPMVFDGAVSAVGALLNSVNKSFSGQVSSSGVAIKEVPKTFAGSVSSSGFFRKSFVRIFTGLVSPESNFVTTFLGRVFGRPGVAAVVVRAAGEAIARVRRG